MKGDEHMSDYFIRFIPEDIDANLNEREIKLVEKLNWDENNPKFIFSERVQLADAGQNFEIVKCQFCMANLMEWWSNAMSSAYSEDYGFVKLEVTTPCCNKTTSLHNLDYSFPQGFYKIMIEVMPKANSKIMSDEIAEDLLAITGRNWRVIHAHY